MVSDAPKHYPVLLDEITALLPLNMVAHLLTVPLVKVVIQKNSKLQEYKSYRIRQRLTK